MASYNLKFNKDDSVVRHLIIGLLSDLNQKLSFYRQLSNDDRVVVDVPFFYAISGDENFLRDNFLFSTLNGVDCEPEGKADGNYDIVPRGIVTMKSLAVDPSKLVNKRNIGHYAKLGSDGNMSGYVSEFEMLPITMGLDIEILLSSQLDIFKVTEAIIKKMYKSNQYNVEVGHLEEGLYRLAAYYAVPDDISMDVPIEYGFDDKQNHKITFSLEINSFIPSFDFSTEQHVGNRMFQIGADTALGDNNRVRLHEDPNISTPNILGDKYKVTSVRLPFDKKNYFG